MTMTRGLSLRIRVLRVGLSLAALAAAIAVATRTRAQDQPQQEVKTPAHFFTVKEPITQEWIEDIRASSQPLLDRAGKSGLGEAARPTFVFEFRPGESKPGQTAFGGASDLADLISRQLRGANMTVAYVPEPLRGYAVLAVLACDEIVMGAEGSIGPMVKEGERIPEHVRAYVRDLARLKGREAGLYLGLLNPAADLRLVRTDDRGIHFVLAEDLAEFKKTHVVIGEESAWEASRPGVLAAGPARERGIIKRIVEDRGQIAAAYHLSGGAAADDPTAGGAIKPLWLPIDGRLDSTQEAYLRRRILQAEQEGLNLIIFQLNCEGGEAKAADNIADLIANSKKIKTIAYISDRALGLACLIPLACHEIVFHVDSRMGDMQHAISAHGRLLPLDPTQRMIVADKAALLAKKNNHSVAIARAMADPDTILLQAKDNQTGASVYILDTDRIAAPDRYTVLGAPKKRQGETLTLSEQDALAMGVTQAVVKDDEELKSLYNLRNQKIRRDSPTWVDSLVTTLNTPWMRTVLLFLGMFMLILELKLPGVGLPAVISALSFLLFFWSSYMNRTADELEIILFLLGIVCLALELFVFPGFGVFGVSGVLLILISIVMASHTFVWPTREAEYKEMGLTLLQVLLILLAVAGGAAAFGRYLPSIPLFNRMVLKPETLEEQLADDETGKPLLSGETSYHHLLGETGRTTTVLKPSGKARFGDELIDVTADGFFIEPDTSIEVIEVQGAKVIVKRA